MKLSTIHFDSYKSLMQANIEFTHECMGMVGINESGKSNVLRAIESLSHEHPLTSAAIPKMAKRGSAASVRFVFQLDAHDVDSVVEAINRLNPLSSEDIDAVRKTLGSVTYHVKYDGSKKAESRYFTLDDVCYPAEWRVLKSDAKTIGCSMIIDGNSVAVHTVPIVSAETIAINERLWCCSEELLELREQEMALQRDIHSTALDVSEGEAASKLGSADLTIAAKANSKAGAHSRLREKEAELSKVRAKVQKLAQEVGEFGMASDRAVLEEDVEDLSIRLTELREVMTPLEDERKTLEALEARDEAQQNQFNKLTKEVAAKGREAQQIQKTLKASRDRLEAMKEPLSEKYVDDRKVLARRFGDLLAPALEERIPPVVFWTHSKDYILKGDTEYSVILEAESLDEISRPLVNLFRIGLGADSLDELKDLIHEIQTSPSLRSRYNGVLDQEINEYLASVWPDYDQRIRVALEQERVLVQFFDPSSRFPGFYEMHERSQGCQTFISFLLTVGAEAKQGVIHDTILLLDEPETHLHPTGVRYMLTELLKAAGRGNRVLFATHSTDMIDKECLERHLIVEKRRERTTIKPSSKDRIGYFMQEEVLYGAINTPAGRPETKKFNFVAEGDGDIRLLETWYRQVLSPEDQPFNPEAVSFYHGGKCSDMIGYFERSPIQLGSKWIFVLDGDAPAKNLSQCLHRLYGNYIDTDIFIYHYKGEKADHCELEDLLPSDLLSKALNSACAKCGVDQVRLKADAPASHMLNQLASSVSQAAPGFKAAVKEAVNGEISSLLGEQVSGQSLANLAPKYSSWFLGVISDLRGKSQGSGR